MNVQEVKANWIWFIFLLLLSQTLLQQVLVAQVVLSVPCTLGRHPCGDIFYVSLVLHEQHISLKAAHNKTTALLCRSSLRKHWRGAPAEVRRDMRKAPAPAWSGSVEHADGGEKYHTHFEFAWFLCIHAPWLLP